MCLIYIMIDFIGSYIIFNFNFNNQILKCICYLIYQIKIFLIPVILNFKNITQQTLLIKN